MPGKWKRIKRTSLALFLAAIITFGVVGDTTKVFAQESDPVFDRQFFSGNDITFYDPTYQNVCAAGGGALVGDNTKEKIWNFFIANDLSPEQAAGIMGNMEEESSFIPTNYQGDTEFNLWAEGTGKAWGLVQWDGGRRLAILNTLRKEKPHLEKYTEFRYDTIGEPNEEFPASDFDEMVLFQLDYMMQESISRDHRSGEGFDGSSDNEWERLKEQSTARKAAIYWHWAFERSSDSPSQITERLDAAETILDEFKDNLSAAGSGTAGCAGAGDLHELTLAYAWPDYRGQYDTAKPAYREAMQQPGVYQGGCNGIDCGAFVTRLLQDSGFEPDYNDRKGNTSEQDRWARENWETLGNAADINTAELRAGDVAIKVGAGSVGHTFVYVADEGGEKIPGFEEVIASSSLCSRAPMAGRESLIDPEFTWYRKR